ncbi:MAG: hypothetical protein AAF696_16245, partial [Bacteroidota bacterium]
GDVAQAVHLGKSASINIPRLNGMKNRKRIQLQGSYRLPFRVSQAVRGLSEKINGLMDEESGLLEPYRGAPPGARPIFVYGEDSQQMALKIKQIVDRYKSYYFSEENEDESRYHLTILEKDLELHGEMNRLSSARIANTDTILRLKGMEKYCIIWSTRAVIEDKEDVYHYIFTILTRSSSILIIALFDDMPEYCQEVFQLFQQEHIICWDEETENFMEEQWK